MEMPYSGNKLHPTQKPVAALARLIRSFSLPEETVLDAFAGSGSTCAAAALTGRRYIGIELDKAYFDQASARLQRIQGGSPQGDLTQRAFQRKCDFLRVPTTPQAELFLSSRNPAGVDPRRARASLA
jgi:adenine specific DNA methylase Mod